MSGKARSAAPRLLQKGVVVATASLQSEYFTIKVNKDRLEDISEITGFPSLKSKDTDVAYFTWTFPPSKMVKLLSPGISFFYSAGGEVICQAGRNANKAYTARMLNWNLYSLQSHCGVEYPDAKQLVVKIKEREEEG